MPERQIWIKNNGFGKIGDTVVSEPALAAFGEQEKAKIFLNVDFNKGHEELFAGHPWIVPIPRMLEGVKPDYEVNHSTAFHEAHAKGIPFGAGFFSQLGMSHEGKRVHYRNYYIEEFDGNTPEKFKDTIIIVPNAYSCTSRDSTTGEFSPNRRPNCQPPKFWWKPVLEAIPKDRKAFVLAANSSWDWMKFEDEGIETVETKSFMYLLSMLKSASLLISVETGTLHLASATKTPTIFLSVATPTVFAKPATECRVVRAWFADELRQNEVVKAMNELLGIS